MLYIYSKINIHHRLNMQIEKIAQTFSLGQFNSVFQYLTEDIEWHIIGEQHLKGMDNIINHCNLIQDYFNKTPHKFTININHQIRLLFKAMLNFSIQIKIQSSKHAIFILSISYNSSL